MIRKGRKGGERDKKASCFDTGQAEEKKRTKTGRRRYSAGQFYSSRRQVELRIFAYIALI